MLEHYEWLIKEYEEKRHHNEGKTPKSDASFVLDSQDVTALLSILKVVARRERKPLVRDEVGQDEWLYTNTSILVSPGLPVAINRSNIPVIPSWTPQPKQHKKAVTVAKRSNWAGRGVPLPHGVSRIK